VLAILKRFFSASDADRRAKEMLSAIDVIEAQQKR